MAAAIEELFGHRTAGHLSIWTLLSLTRLAFVALIVAFLARIFYNIFLHPLRTVPGPWWHAATGLARFKMYMSGDSHKTILELHKKYGDVVRIGPNEVSFAASHGWSDVYGQKRVPAAEAKHDNAYIENPKERLFYSIITRPNSLIKMAQHDHIIARKTINSAFSTKAVANQEHLIQGHIDGLIKLLRNAAEKSVKTEKGAGTDGNVVDVVSYTNCVFFDITGELGLGESFGSLVNGYEHAWVAVIPKAVKTAVTMIMMRRLLGNTLGDIIVWLKMTTEARTNLARHRALSDEKVERRAALGPGRPDFITPMLEHGEFWNKSRLNDSLATFITAGSETSATTMSAAMLYLTTTKGRAGGPSPLEKLTAEVRGAFKSDAEINFAGVKNLTYLGAVLDETLRMHPPAVWGFGREAKKGGTVVANGQYYLPEATVLTICQYAMFHNPRNFALADSFIPERWLTGADADPRCANDQRDCFYPFSYGPRNCIGRYLAIAEMRTILARIVFNFDVAIQPGSERWAVDQKTYAFWDKPPLMVAINPRADKV